MSFSENLRAVRKEKNLSQEQLAELLDVSRQAVSKWESEGGYPETEKLILIAQKLNVSLDSLLLDKQIIDGANDDVKKSGLVFPVDKKITIKSWDGKTSSAFYKFTIRKNLTAGKNDLKYMLCGTDSSSFLGDSITDLGWYKTFDDVQAELTNINKAIQNGEVVYELKFHDPNPKLKRFGIISGW